MRLPPVAIRLRVAALLCYDTYPRPRIGGRVSKDASGRCSGRED